MRDRRFILVAVVVLLLAGAVVVHKLRARVAAGRVAQLDQQLKAQDARTRLDAAMEIVHIDPSHRPARLTQVRALLEDGRRSDARQILTGIEADRDMQWADEALELHAGSYLDEAAESLVAATPSTIGSVRESVEALISEAAGRRRQMTINAATEGIRAVLEAREADLQATILWRIRQARELDLAKNQNVRFQERVDMLGLQINELVRDTTTFDARANELATRALAKRPLDHWPRLVMFHTRLRSGDWSGARQVATDIVAQPELLRADAGEIADTLLNLELFFARNPEDADVQLAGRIMTLPVTGPDAIRYDLARAALAQREKKADAAEAILRETLTRYPANPRATCMLAAALVRAHRAQEAIALLEPFNQRTHSAEGKVALGSALVAEGDTAHGLDTLRQGVAMEPASFSAQLTFIEALINNGSAVEAEPSILAASTLNPGDPRVRAAQAILLVEKLDRKQLIAAMQRPDAPITSWRHAALAAAMVLDDMAMSQGFAADLRTARGDDPLVLIYDGWRRASPRKRSEAAALVARTVLQAQDADPLLWPEPPSVGVLDHASTSAGEAGDAPPADALTKFYFVPLPIQTALDLTDVALRSEPRQAALLELSAGLALWTGQPPAAREKLQRRAALPAPMGALPMTIKAYLERSAAPPRTQAAVGPLDQWLAIAEAVRRKDRGAALDHLKKMLAEHPWAEAPVLLTVRDALFHGGPDAARDVITAVRAINPALALLAQARLALAQGLATDAIKDIGTLLHDEDADSEIRVQATEVSARANLLLDKVEVGMGGFETMSFASPDQRIAMRIGAADLELEAGRRHPAASKFASLLAEPALPPRMVDRLLTRCERITPLTRFSALMERLLQYDSDNATLLVYKARALTDARQFTDADAIVKRLVELRPEAPRVEMTRAWVAAAAGHREEAGEIYGRLVAKGVLTPAAGQAALEKLAHAGAPAPTAPADQGDER